MPHQASKERVCVLGLGYVGLPTACTLAAHDISVTGVDINPTTLDHIRAGKIYEPGLRTLVHTATGSGKLDLSTQPIEAGIFIIAVPTPLVGRRPDLSAVFQAARALTPLLRKGNLVILESTVPPGTTATVADTFRSSTRLKIGRDLFMAHCPERVMPGRILTEMVENDRIIGGVTPDCASRAAAFYARFVEGKIFKTSADIAEMAKLMENTYRDVNIALANECARIADHLDIDIREVIRLANRHPRVQFLQPGPGVGGDCLAVDPWFLAASASGKSRLIPLARLTNDRQPFFIVERIRRLLRGIRRPRVAVLGVAYKGDTDDTRNSPARPIVRALKKMNWEVRIFDPLVQRFDWKLTTVTHAARNADLLLVLAAHKAIRLLSPLALKSLVHRRKVFDTCACLPAQDWRRAGFEIVT